MPKFTILKSIFIEAPVERVHALVRDFRQWPAWSPWLIAEPESRLDYSADGTGYAWEGRITGSGEMRVVREDAPHSIDCQLTFLKPWKSVNSVRFTFTARDGGTEVAWSMEGSLPFFLFWMRSMMSAWIGADYQRGLMMLKAVIETGSNPSRLAFPGPQEFPGVRYAGVRSRCAIADIATRMRGNMDRITAWLESSGSTAGGPPFSICHQWDPVKGTTDFTLAFPFDTAATPLPADFVSGEIPACRVYQVRHTGPYRFLGNAWAAGVMHGRAKLYAADKRISPFELYQNDPATTPEDGLVTLLHFPMK